jgi:hypothetical protein
MKLIFEELLMSKIIVLLLSVLIVSGCNSQPKSMKAPCDRDAMFCGEKTKINTGEDE